MSISAQELRFVDAYLANGLNATKAASEAGFIKGINLLDPKARKTGFMIKGRKDVKAEIDKRLSAYALSGDELLALQAEVARADISDMFYLEDVCCPVCAENGLNTIVVRENTFSMKKAIAVGKSHLVKEIQHLRNGIVTKIVLHDALEARNSLMKALSMFTTKTDTAVSGFVELMAKALSDKQLDAKRPAPMLPQATEEIEVEVLDS